MASLSSHRRRRRFILVTTLIITLLYLHRGLSDASDQLTKRLPTLFPTTISHSTSHHPLRHPSHPLRLRTPHGIDTRYTFSHTLSAGQEGRTAIYTDTHSLQPVVVKTFSTTSRNPLRTEVIADFEGFAEWWPAEIEAGLVFEGTEGLVEVVDYFILFDGDEWEWALVSEWVQGGTLGNLARRVAGLDLESVREVDERFRGRWVELLERFKVLHGNGLCHDDVKMDNVFVQDDEAEWLIGDLGSVREVEHEWHRTKSWARQNQWQDCRLNDVRRLIKTYLWFLRLASGDAAGFDRQFWTGESDWSRLYWDWIRVPQYLDDTIEALQEGRLGRHDDSGFAATIVSKNMPCMDEDDEYALATERELICTTMPRRLWNPWWRWMPVW